MDVQKRISELLYLKECLVIPGFGAFVSRYVPARIREESQTIIPPSRSIVFNSMLVQDDGELIGYMSRFYKAGITESREAVDQFVDRLKSELASKGSFLIPSVGELRYARTGELIFNQEEGVNFLPAAYGLSSIQFSRLPLSAIHPLTRRALGKDVKDSNAVLANNRKISERQKAARRVVLAIPLLIAISLLPINSRNGSNKLQNNAGFFSMPSLSVNELTGKEAQVENVTNDRKGIVNYGADDNENKMFSREQHAIVAGSFSSRENAEALKSSLESRGYYNEIWEASNGFFRVVIQTHKQLSDAQKAAAELKKELKGIEFWILQ